MPFTTAAASWDVRYADLSSVKECDSTLNCSFKHLIKLSLHNVASLHDCTHMTVPKALEKPVQLSGQSCCEM